MSRMNPGMQAKLEAERRLKEGISGHRTGLPKKLLDLFAPGEPPDQLSKLKKPKLKLPYTGIAQYVNQFANQDEPEYEPPPNDLMPSSPRLFGNPELHTQARVEDESIWERRIRKQADKVEQAKEQIHQDMKDWDPTKDPTATGDPFKTLFVARLSYDVTERKLSREFEEYGPIKNIRLVHDKNSGKSRGYAFIEFEHKNDMKAAYKMADGKKLEGKRITVDVERGRTVPNWRPRRFGGGKGGESRERKVSKKKAKLAHLYVAPKPPAADDRDDEVLREKQREREELVKKERAREQDRPKAEPNGYDAPAPRERDEDRRDRDRDRDRPRDRDRDHRDRDDRRDRERKRDRGDREKGERDRYDDHRSSKRHRDDRDRSSRRRERDL